jgi:hypothetical protein
MESYFEGRTWVGITRESIRECETSEEFGQYMPRKSVVCKSRIYLYSTVQSGRLQWGGRVARTGEH